MIIANQVGELLAQLPGLPLESIHSPDLRRVIDSCKARCIGGTNQLVRMSGFSKGALSAMLGGAKAGLDTWIRVAAAADVSLAGLFADELWREGVNGKTCAFRNSLFQVRKLNPIDWPEVRRAAEARIADGTASGFYAFCREMDMDAHHAGKMLGELRNQLNAVGAVTQAKNEARSVDELAATIRTIAANYGEQGLRLSARSIARHLQSPRMSRDFRAAYSRISQEVGGRHYVGRRRV